MLGDDSADRLVLLLAFGSDLKMADQLVVYSVVHLALYSVAYSVAHLALYSVVHLAFCSGLSSVVHSVHWLVSWSVYQMVDLTDYEKVLQKDAMTAALMAVR